MADIKTIMRTDSDSGRIYLRNGVLLAFFVAKHVHEVSESLITAFEQYLNIIPIDTLRWAITSATAEEWKEVNPKTIPRCKASLAPEGARKRALTSFHLNDSGADAPGYSFSLIGKGTDEDIPEEVTWIQMTFPLDAISEDRVETFVSQVQLLAESIPFTSGYCSPAFLFSELYTSQAFADLRGIATRYPGYDVQYNRDTQFIIDKKLRGARWITLVGWELVEQLGETSELKRQLPAPISVEEIKPGIIIRAGILPEIGDVNRRVDTPLLRAVAKVLEPVTIFGESAMLIYFAQRDEDFLRRWERRFLD